MTNFQMGLITGMIIWTGVLVVLHFIKGDE